MHIHAKKTKNTLMWCKVYPSIFKLVSFQKVEDSAHPKRACVKSKIDVILRYRFVRLEQLKLHLPATRSVIDILKRKPVQYTHTITRNLPDTKSPLWTNGHSWHKSKGRVHRSSSITIKERNIVVKSSLCYSNIPNALTGRHHQRQTKTFLHTHCAYSRMDRPN